MTDYLLLFVELYWSITLYWSSFSVSVRLWGFQKAGNRDGHGAGYNVCDELASICAWLIDTWILIPLNLITCAPWRLFW